MSSSYFKDDKIIVEGSSEQKDQGSSETQTIGVTEVKSDPHGDEAPVSNSSEEQGERSEEAVAPHSDTDETVESQNEETKAVAVPIEEVDSRLPSTSSKASSSTERTKSCSRLLLKRRSSRLRTPTVSRSKRAAEEVDSAVPLPKRRKTKKPSIALFSEKDYPRKN